MIAFYFIFFILVYYAGASFLGISSIVRYQVSLYPVASIVAAIGLSHMLEFGKIKKCFMVSRFYFLMAFLIVASICSLFLIKPFYLEYSSVFFASEIFVEF